jgi:hemerythrin superfamily protein
VGWRTRPREIQLNAITVLKNDHKRVEQLFKKFEKLGEGAESAKQALVKQIIEELTVHASIEEQVFYPASRREVEETEDTVLESLEEHHIVKWTLSELEKMKPSDERYDAKVSVLIESVRHHVEEEEQELFPEVSKKLTRKELNQIGEDLEKARLTAPKRPQPTASDTPRGKKG